MAFSVGDIIATLDVDRTPFSRGLAAAIREGEAWERRAHFKATLDVDDKRGLQRLKDFAREAKRMRAGKSDVDVDTRGAAAKIAALKAQLKAIPDEKVTIELNVDRPLRALRVLGGALGAMKVQGAFALAALGGAALSAGVAITGISAAALGVLGPLGALALGVRARMKEGGAATKEFKATLKDLGETFTKTLGPGADAVMRGMSRGLKSVSGMLPELKDNFTGLGRAAGGALERLLKHVSSPAWTEFFKTMIDGARDAVGPLGKAIAALLDIFKNLATAGMPIFIRLLKEGTKELEEFAKKTSNIKALRAAIEEGVAALGKMAAVAKNVGSIILSIFRAGESAGFLDALKEATAELAKFAKSAEGQESLKELFKAIVPFVRELAKAIPALLPVFTRLLAVINTVFAAVLKVVGALGKIPVIGPELAAIAVAFLAWRGPLRTVSSLISGIAGGLAAIARRRIATSLVAEGAGGAAGGALGSRAAQARAGSVAGAAAGGGFLAGLLTKLKGLPGKIGTLLKGVGRGGAARGVVAAGAGLGGGLVAGLLSKVKGLGGKLKGGLGTAVKTATRGIGAPMIAAGALLVDTLVKTVKAKGLGNKLKAWVTGALKSIPWVNFGIQVGKLLGVNVGKGIDTAKRAVATAGKAVATAAVKAAKAVATAAKEVGKFLGDAVAKGWEAVKSVAKAAKDVAEKAVKVAKGVAGAAKAAGKFLGDAVAKGWGAVKSVAKAAKDVAMKALKGLSSVLNTAKEWGRKIVEGIVKGITGAAGLVKEAVSGLLSGAASLLPFSEPKDRSSPMYGLGRSGGAMVANLARGIRDSRQMLRREMADALGGALVGREVEVAARIRGAKMAKETAAAAMAGVGASGDVNVNMGGVLVPQDPRVARQAQAGIARAERHGRRRKPVVRHVG